MRRWLPLSVLAAGLVLTLRAPAYARANATECPDACNAAVRCTMGDCVSEACPEDSTRFHNVCKMKSAVSQAGRNMVDCVCPNGSKYQAQSCNCKMFCPNQSCGSVIAAPKGPAVVLGPSALPSLADCVCPNGRKYKARSCNCQMFCPKQRCGSIVSPGKGGASPARPTAKPKK